MSHNPIYPLQIYYGHFVSWGSKIHYYCPFKMNIAIKSPKWNQQKYNLSLWQTANITSVARNFRSNKDFQSQVKWQRSFFLSRQRTSNLDERFVSDALLTAPSFVSLQCTWQRSLTRWSSVTLKSQPTGFITTLIIVALMHSASTTSHLWKGRAHSRTFHELRPNQTRGKWTATSHYLAWFPSVTLL